MTWLSDGGLSVDPPKKTKKITGTRFGAVLDRSPWHTPFEMWCECSKTYEKPFEDTIYTKAGKIIERKQTDFISMFYDGVQTPEDVFGKDFFQQTHGDFFPDSKYFGGMWDSLITDEEGNPTKVIEFKTTKRVEDWENDIPEYYALQASLYATLLGIDDVLMVCTVLEDKDYIAPEVFDVNTSNTFSREFKVSERYPDMGNLIDYCSDWYEKYVLTGISPIPTDKDKEILNILHTEYIDPDTDTEELMKQITEYKEIIDDGKARLKDAEKMYKKLTDVLKSKLTKGKTCGEIISLQNDDFIFTFTPSRTEAIDTERMKAEGIYDRYKYLKPYTYTLRIKENKGNEN